MQDISKHDRPCATPQTSQDDLNVFDKMILPCNIDKQT